MSFDARLAGVPLALLEAHWEAVDALGTGPRSIVSNFRSADSIST